MCMAVAGQSGKHVFIAYLKLFKIDTPQTPGQCIGIIASTPYLLFFQSSPYRITASASRPPLIQLRLAPRLLNPRMRRVRSLRWSIWNGDVGEIILCYGVDCP